MHEPSIQWFAVHDPQFGLVGVAARVSVVWRFTGGSFPSNWCAISLWSCSTVFDVLNLVRLTFRRSEVQ